MRRLFQSLHRHQFFSLTGGIAACNILSLFTMPLLTRVYSSEAFGYFAIFWSLATILGIFSTLRLELAIPLASSATDRALLARAARYLSLILMSLFLLLWYATPLARLVKSPGGGFEVCIVAAAFLTAVLQIQTQISIHLGRLTAISVRHIVEKLTVIAASVAFMRAETFGLILAQICGLAAGSAVLLVANRPRGDAPLPPRGFTWPAIIRVLKAHRDFPLKNGPSTLFQILTSQLPPLFFGSLFSVGSLGFYNLAQRLMDAPNVLVSSGLSVVYYRRMLTAHKGDMRRIFLRATRWLGLALLVPACALLLFSKPLVVYAFGARWEDAHVFLLLLLPLACSRMLFVAGQSLFLILRRLDQDLIVSACVFAATMAGLALGYLAFGTLEGCVGTSSALTALSYLGGLILIDRDTRKLKTADKI